MKYRQTKLRFALTMRLGVVDEGEIGLLQMVAVPTDGGGVIADWMEGNGLVVNDVESRLLVSELNIVKRYGDLPSTKI